MDNPSAQALMAQVMAHPKYKTITSALVLRLSQEAIAAGLSGKPALKYVRNKLHQVGGAYFKEKVDYAAAMLTLQSLPLDLNAPQTLEFCLDMLRVHTSTIERLPIIETFFSTCLAPIAPVTSVSDLACGLNPLAIPWMPLAQNATYHACDIYGDMLDLIQAFFTHFNLAGQAMPCDLITHTPREHSQVTFLLKSIPCLEQMYKAISVRLLEQINSDHILVSFPAHSLGGRKKGMPAFYRDHFYALISGQAWTVHEFTFATELAFLVSK